MRDSALRRPPLAPADARAMLESLQGYPLLAGARGHAPADLDAAVGALCAFSDLCLDLAGEVEAIDVNPLVVLPAGRGVRALDCLIVRRGLSAALASPGIRYNEYNGTPRSSGPTTHNCAGTESMSVAPLAVDHDADGTSRSEDHAREARPRHA